MTKATGTKQTHVAITKYVEQIRDMVKVDKKDIKKVLQALWDLQVDEWLEHHKVICPPVGYVYVKEIHKDFIIDRETKEHLPGERWIYKIRTQKTIAAADKWCESKKGYYHDFYSR